MRGMSVEMRGMQGMWGIGWECRESGWECGAQVGNAGNKGGNMGNEGGKAGNIIETKKTGSL